MKTRLIVLVTLFMMLICGSAFADVSGGSITRLRNTSDGQKIVIFTQEGYSVASVVEFVANKPMEERNVIEAINGFLTQPGRVRILDEHTHSADNYIDIEYTHLTEEAANRWLSNKGQFGAVQVGSITKMRNTSDGQKIVIFTQEGYSVASVVEFVANKPMEERNVIEAINGFLTQPGRVRILDEHTHSADNYIDIEYTHLTEEAANRWLSNKGQFGAVQVGSITKMRNTRDGLKMVIFTQEGYSVASVLEFVADKPMEASNAIEAVNGFLTDTGKVRILDEYTHSADNYIDIEAAYLSEETANRWLANGGRF